MISWFFLSSYEYQVLKTQCDFSSFSHTYACMLANDGSVTCFEQVTAFGHLLTLAMYLTSLRGMPTRYHHLLFLRQLGLLPLFLKTHSARQLGNKCWLSAHRVQCTSCLPVAFLASKVSGNGEVLQNGQELIEATNVKNTHQQHDTVKTNKPEN